MYALISDNSIARIEEIAGELVKCCLQSPMIVQHQLDFYRENCCQLLYQLSKKSGARDCVQPPLLPHYTATLLLTSSRYTLECNPAVTSRIIASLTCIMIDDCIIFC